MSSGRCRACRSTNPASVSVVPVVASAGGITPPLIRVCSTLSIRLVTHPQPVPGGHQRVARVRVMRARAIMSRSIVPWHRAAEDLGVHGVDEGRLVGFERVQRTLARGWIPTGSSCRGIDAGPLEIAGCVQDDAIPA